MGGDKCAPRGERGCRGRGACGKSMGSGASNLGSSCASGYTQVLRESLTASEPAVPYLQHPRSSTYRMGLLGMSPR